MKKNLLFCLTLLSTASLMAADAAPKDDVTAAAKALAGQPNYAWRTTVENAGGGGGGPFRRGPTDGKTDKDGYILLSVAMGDNTMDAVVKGTNAAIKTAEKGWQSLAEATQDDGGGGPNPMMFFARTLTNLKTPSAQALSLVGNVKALTAGTNGISGDLTDEAAKAELSFRRPAGGPGGPGGGEGPTISNAKGSVTFWVTDGKLVKYQVHVTGSMSFNGNDRDIDRTTVTEIKDVGTTKVEMPDDAKKKLQ